MAARAALIAAWLLLAAPSLAQEPAPVAPPTSEPAPAPAPPEHPPAPPPAPPPPPPAPEQPPPSEPVADPEPEEEAKEEEKPRAQIAADATVTISDFEFGPASVTVNVGDTVTWTNRGPTEHTATGRGFDTGLLDRGESGSHTFDSAGTFSYICTPHPFMEGTVRVAAASGGGGGDQGEAAPSPQDDSAAAPQGQDTTAGGQELANTGSDSNALAVLGLLLLAAGIAVRRRATPPA